MSYHKAPGSSRWCEVTPSETGQRIQVLGPLASKALDGDLFETGPELPYPVSDPLEILFRGYRHRLLNVLEGRA